jgi:osmoprotectant transport system ATP-binding protein
LIRFSSVSKRLSDDFELKNINLHLERGTTTALIGASGSGKSTVLRLLSGLVEPDQGTILVEGQNIFHTNMTLYRQKIGFMVQQGGLFPHLTVEQNVLIVGRYLKRDREVLQDRLASLCQLVSLAMPLMARYPHELSGGQRQRVGLIRALMLDPEILLLDEPLGALDPIVRHDLQQELRDLFAQLQKTVLLVTHDLNEAQFLAKHLILMQNGAIVQDGLLSDFLDQPASTYVTKFFSAWNQGYRAEQKVAS